MNIKLLFHDAMLNFQQGNLSSAEKCLTKIISKYPNHADALSNLAIIKINLDETEDAIRLFNSSLKVKYNSVVLRNYIQLLLQKKKWDLIIQCQHDFHDHIKNNETIKLQIAVAHREKGDLKKAKELFNDIIKASPNTIDAYIGLGFTMNMNNEFDSAIETYTRGLEIEPNNFILNYNLGIAYANTNQAIKSIKMLEKAIKINDSHFNLWITLAAQYTKIRQVSDAMIALEKCRKIDPGNILTLFQEATIKMQIGEIDEAERLFLNIIKIKPDDIETNYHLGLIKLMKHDFDNAMKFYRYRTKRTKRFGEFDDFELPDIDPNKNILLIWEQGIGDQFLYLRLINEFIKTHNNVTYIATDKTKAALENIYKKIKIISYSEYTNTKDKYNDYQKLNLASMINYIPNLNNKFQVTEKVEVLNEKTNKQKVIGISWKSENDKIGDEKSIDLEKFSKLITPTNKYISLQYGDVDDEIKRFNEKNDVNLMIEKNLDYFNDIKGLMDLISQCDFVITISNITVHLAGSLSIPTILLCPKSHGKLWYWYGSDETSIWYPSVKILRQSNDKSWENEINQIKELLF